MLHRVLSLCILFAALPVRAEEAPPWVAAGQGVATRSGKRLAFSVGAAEDSDPVAARAQAAAKARQGIADLVLDQMKPPPKTGKRRTDLFSEMGVDEAVQVMRRATIPGIKVDAFWSRGAQTYTLATVPTQTLEETLRTVPGLDGGARKAALASLEGAFEALEQQTQIQGNQLPDPKARDFKKSKKGPPEWIRRGCGHYMSKKGKIWFGVGVASDIRDQSLARGVADNRARNEISNCMSFTVVVDNQARKTFSERTMWGVQIVDRHISEDSIFYALAEVPDSQVAPATPMIERRVEPPPVVKSPPTAQPEPTKTPPPPAACPSRQKAKGLRVALAVIGPEADPVRQTITSELERRGFSVLGLDSRKRPHGQLALTLRGAYADANQKLNACHMEIEFLRGAETLNQGAYSCVVGAPPDEPVDVGVFDLHQRVDLIKCSIAENLWHAAKAVRGR